MKLLMSLDVYNQKVIDGVAMPLRAKSADSDHIPCVVVVRDCWTIDEKMGQTYIHKDQANTLAQRDYKQPQAVIYEEEEDDIPKSNRESNGELASR